MGRKEVRKGLGIILILIAFISIESSCQSTLKENESYEAIDSVWSMMDDIVNSIIVPEFPENTFIITEFGAVGDGVTNCTEAFRKAIEACTKAGGGKVVVPKGKYYTGPIHLESNINLHLEKGAIVQFSTKPEDYHPLVFTRWEGVECMNFSPLVYAYEKENIAITGSGVLDGMSSEENWWPWKGRRNYGWVEGTPQQEDSAYRPALFRMNETEVPARERIFGMNKYLRPQFVQPYKCKNVLIQGITIKNSPMWLIHPVLCENVTVRKVKIISHGPNSDGCDPEACKNVLIEDCYFDTGDDCIALKSGRNHDGFLKGIPCENVVIRNCEMKDGHGGVVIGSEISGGAKYVFAENCKMSSPNLDRAIRIKTNKARGGIIEHVYIRNIEVGEVARSVIIINLMYTMDSEDYVKLPTVRNIYINNLISKKSRYGISLIGLDESKIQDVTITNCDMKNVIGGNRISNVERLKTSNILINDEAWEAE